MSMTAARNQVASDDEAQAQPKRRYNTPSATGIAQANVAQPELKANDEVFAELAARWSAETQHLSSMHEIVIHPAYAQIIGMGGAAISLILRELRDRPDAWFYALTAITRDDPAEGMSSFDAAVEAWLKWGEDRRYI